MAGPAGQIFAWLRGCIAWARAGGHYSNTGHGDRGVVDRAVVALVRRAGAQASGTGHGRAAGADGIAVHVLAFVRGAAGGDRSERGQRRDLVSAGAAEQGGAHRFRGGH